MNVHLVDGTYELFRHYYALPSARDAQGQEVAAVRGVVASVLGMIKEGATHVAVATDHVVESFRNDLWAGYKTSEGVEAELLAQFPLLEEALSAAGILVWPMVEYEADDALASAVAGLDMKSRTHGIDWSGLVSCEAHAEVCLNTTSALENAIKQNVLLNVERLKAATPIIEAFVSEKKVQVVGAVYHLDDGRIELLS